MRFEKPAKDTFRFVRDYRTQSSRSIVVHTNTTCPHFQHITNPVVVEPGEGIPKEHFNHRQGGWCEWCSKREVHPGEYA